jgi:hypothetical protein
LLKTLNVLNSIANPQSEIRNPQSFMLRPRLELGSRTDLVLAGYKPAALPIELPEQFNNWCARRDSNPPPRFKRPVLRHQSFGRMALAAGFEPALTALEEQRLVPLGHASIKQRDRRDSNSRSLDRQSSA